MSVDPRIPRAFTSATEGEPHAPTGRTGPAPPDPLRLCVATTVALIAWLVSPPVAVIGFATLAIVAYVRAYRAGLLACLLYTSPSPRDRSLSRMPSSA